MKTIKTNVLKGILLVFVALLSGQQLFAQDALTSVKINIQNLVMSTDRKTISYDVYIQDVDASGDAAVAGFLFRLAVPVAELGAGAKTVTVTNPAPQLGSTGVLMSILNDNWVMKFTQANLITSYLSAMEAEDAFPGSRIGTFNISNEDGTPFSNPQSFTAIWAGSSPSTKSTVTLFQTGTTYPATNSSVAQPESNFNGLGNKSLSVSKLPLTISGVTATSRVYNGTTSVSLSGGSLVGVQSGDNVTLVTTGATGTIADKTAGNGKAVTVTGYSISGTNADKYTLSQPTGITVNITKATLNVTGVTASNKVYDRGTTASLSGGSLSGAISGDVVSLVPGTGSFATKTVGNAKTVTATGYSASGADAGNYSVSQPTGISANITPVTVSITGLSVANKVYNGNTSATFSGGTLSGVLSGDVVSISTGTGTFASSNVGTGISVTATGFGLTGTDGGNYVLSGQPTGLSGNITAATLNVTGVTASSKPYDGTTSATLSGGTLSGLVSGDVVNLSPGSGTFASKTVGTGKTVNATGYSISGTDAGNYTLNQPSGITANITQLALTVIGVTASNKEYNGTTAATLTGGSLSGVISGDAVTLVQGTGNFANKNVGTGKTITATGYGVSGTDAGNYTVSQPTGLSATITQKSVSISGISVNSKTYNGTTAATFTGGTINGTISGDAVTISNGTVTFTSSNVGTGISVTATGFGLSGTDAANYVLSGQPTGLSANITAATLNVTGVTASSKPYDGTTSATLSGGTLSGLVSGDVVNLSAGSGTFASKTVGTGKTVNASGYSISGTDAGNYTLNQPTGITANITSLSLNVIGVTASNKVYNGTTSATLSGGSLSGVINGDAVTLVQGTGNFANKTVGTGKTITATGYGASGADAANYTVSQPTGLSADITAKSVSITGVTAQDKPYDGTTTATLTGGTLSGAVTGDNVTIVPGTGSFADKNVGTNKTVTAIGYTLGGTDASNYTLSGQPTGMTANITSSSASTLTISGVTAADKVYDGTTSAVLSGGTLVGVAPGDDVTLELGTGDFNTKNVGTAKDITAKGYKITGANAGNYVLSQPTGLKANVTPKSVSISGVTANSKPYDGTTTATLTGGTLSGTVTGDNVTIVPGTGSFADKNVGTNKTVTATGYTLGGTDASNYTLSAQPTGMTANITASSANVLTISGVTAANKEYDGTTSAVLSGGTLVGVASGDVVTLVPGTGTFNTKNVGTAKDITATGYSLSGANASNYTLEQPTGVKATITPKSVSITGVTANSKPYDGNTTATLTGGTLTGVITGDNVTIVPGTGSFADKNVGTNKTVTATGYTLGGTDASNYTLSGQPTGMTANITATSASILTISGVTAANKVYDGTTSAVLSGGTLVGVAPGDVVTLVPGTGTFNTKNVGTAKDITATGYSLSGANASNYTLEQPTGIKATITPKSVSITGVTASNKSFDNTTTATLTGGTLTGIIAGDNVTIVPGTGNFADSNVGTNKTVTASGYTLGGTDASNYTLSAQPTGMTATITSAAIVTLNITGITAMNKNYDGNTTATLTGGTLVGVASGDNVTLVPGTATFANKALGTGKTVTATGFSLSGADAGKYALNQPTGLTADILPAPLTITGIAASNKVYDGTTTAYLSGGVLIGVVPGESVTTSSATGTFADKNVGNGKPIIISGHTLMGPDVANYTLVEPTNVTANITPLPVTVSGLTVSNKVYDGRNTATITGGVLNGVLTGDNVNLVSGSGLFNDKHAETNKTVNAIGFSLSGTDAGNYLLTQPTNLVASITPKSLLVNGMTANNKVYDGTTTATFTGGTLTGIINGDDLILKNVNGTFSTKYAAPGKSVTVTGISFGGADSSNYVLNSFPTGLTAEISPLALNIVGMAALDKDYDGTTNATLTIGMLTGLIPGDVVSVSPGSGTFADKNAGEDKAVTISGFSISGVNARNYTIAQPTNITASIRPASLSLIGLSANNKVYDGTTRATLSTCTLSGVKSGDVVGLTPGTGSFIDKHAGESKRVLLSGYTLTGADAINYSIADPIVTASITKAPLTISDLSTTSKVYDGTTAAILYGGTLSGVITGDSVKLVAGMGHFDNKNVGKGKRVTITGCTITGADTSNYAFRTSTEILTADITPAPVTIAGLTALNRAYDGTANVTISGGALIGCVSGDNVTVVSGKASFADKNAGTDKPVVFTGYSLTGTGAKNYQMEQPSGITATITPLPIQLTGVIANNKVYDGTNVTTLSGGKIVGILSGDAGSLVLGKGQFADKNAGNGKAIEVVGCKFSGSNEQNYTLTQPTGLTANITPAQINISDPMIRLRKQYDGNTAAAVSPGILSGVAFDDIDNISVEAQANYDNALVGKNKTITVTYQLFGVEASNYLAPLPSIFHTGEITSSSTNPNDSTIQLTVANTQIALSKTYDGTTSATVVPGTLVGVSLQDQGNVVLHAAASYNNAAVGVGKTITVTYSLTGSAAYKYTIASAQQYTGGEIKPRQLTISGLNVIKSKTEDGNALAKIASQGSLIGVVTSDRPNVSLKINAYYEDATIGENKTIFLNFSLEGQAMGNYLAPIDSIITGAAISEKIKLNPIVVTPPIATNPTIGMTYDVVSGTPAQYKFTFDSTAIKAGLQNTVFKDLQVNTENDTIKFTIPDGAKDGNYKGTLVVKDTYGTDSVAYSFNFTVNVASYYIVKIFDDVITCNNVENRFVGFQWYRNGERIFGANKQVYQEKGGLDGTYYLELTKKDGTKAYSYPKTFTKTEQTASKKASVYPNPVKSNRPFTIELNGLTDEDLSKAVLSLYSLKGVCVFQTNNLESVNTILLSLPTQDYVGHIRSENGLDLSFRVKVVN